MLTRPIGILFVLLVGVGCAGGGEPTVEDPGPAVVGDQIRIAGTDDFRFRPPTVTVEAGTYEIVFRNEGTNFHQLALSGKDGHEEAHSADTGEIPGGRSETISVDLEPGTYEYGCHLPGHYEAGMKGTLTVTE